MSKKWRRILGVGIASLVLVGAAWAVLIRTHKPTAATPPAKTPITTTKPAISNTLSFVAMGDMLAHDSIDAQAKTATGYDFKPYFTHIRPLYKDADVVFCNPETIAAGAAFGITGYPVFNAPSEFSGDIVQGAGCNLINLATNHINDRHQAGIDSNLDAWAKQPVLAYAGSNKSAEEQSKVRYFTKNGVKVAFLAFADYSNDKNLTPFGVNFYHDTALVERLFKEARVNADAVIVSAHWGTEDSNTVNADQIATAQSFADLGADVVIGTGPHVLQKVSYVTAADGRKVLVWYSIGNMLSSQLQVNELTGIIAGFTLTRDSPGAVTVSQPTAQITFMSYDWLAADKEASKLETRSNFVLQPLHAARNAPSKMFGATYTGTERESYVKTTLTTEIDIKVTP